MHAFLEESRDWVSHLNNYEPTTVNYLHSDKLGSCNLQSSDYAEFVVILSPANAAFLKCLYPTYYKFI